MPRFETSPSQSMVLIGAPFADGQDWFDGVDMAPNILREGGLIEVIKDLRENVEDVGDINIDSEEPCSSIDKIDDNIMEYSLNEIKNCDLIGGKCGNLHKEVLRHAEKGKFVLTVGGDHSIAVATISAMKRARPQLGVIWVDAHGDCNTPESSQSQNYHGMPAAHLLNWFNKRAPGFEWLDDYLRSPLSENRLALIGLRDIDAGERELLRRSKIQVYTMRDVDRYGISGIMEKILSSWGSDCPLHLSFDIDAIDPTIAPGTGTKANGGLSYRESHYICYRLADTGRLVSMDLVEINPSIDTPSKFVSSETHSPSTSSTSIYSNDNETSNLSERSILMHGDNRNITANGVTVRLGIELIESALGKSIV